jgi:hypothetical protein
MKVLPNAQVGSAHDIPHLCELSDVICLFFVCTIQILLILNPSEGRSKNFESG